MCSTFSVCSRRCSVIMMSMTSCNLLLASFGASSSSVGRALKWYRSASVCFVCERTIRPETDPLSLLCPGVDNHQRSSHLCSSRFKGRWFAFRIFGHKQTSTLIPHNRLASCRARYSSFRVPVTSVPCVAGCLAGTTVLHAAVSTPNVMTPTAWPTDSNAVTRRLVTHPIVLPIYAPSVVTTRQLALKPMCVPICVPSFVPTFVTTSHLVLDPIAVPNLFFQLL